VTSNELPFFEKGGKKVNVNMVSGSARRKKKKGSTAAAYLLLLGKVRGMRLSPMKGRDARQVVLRVSTEEGKEGKGIFRLLLEKKRYISHHQRK